MESLDGTAMVRLRGESLTHHTNQIKRTQRYCYAVNHAYGSLDLKEIYEQLSGANVYNSAGEAQDAGYSEMLEDDSYQQDWDNWIVYIFDSNGRRVDSSGDEY